MTYANTTEKFDLAVTAMASGTGNIRARIWKAYLSLHMLSESDFSDELKEDWNFIYSNLTKEKPEYDDEGEVTIESVQNSLRSIGTDGCVAIAERICHLDAKLHAAVYQPA